MKKYSVSQNQHGEWVLFENVEKGGERLDAYNSTAVYWEPVKRYQGTLSDCYAYIQLNNSGYIKL